MHVSSRTCDRLFFAIVASCAIAACADDASVIGEAATNATGVADSSAEVTSAGSAPDTPATAEAHAADTGGGTEVAIDAVATAGDAGDSGDSAAKPQCVVAADCTGATGACHMWACNAGSCVLGASFDGTPCDDANACTGGDACKGAVCMPGAVSPCDDGTGCTDDSCSGGKCIHTPNKVQCSDGSACTTGDTCQDGNCTGGASVACADGKPCTTDSCEPGKGCVFNVLAGACDDNNACTAGDGCQDGVCLPGAPTNCDDSNLCTLDSCDVKLGCTHSNNSLQCSDNNPCTTGDTCSDGACAGSAKLACDDGNLCTDDSCDVAKGCASLPNTATCSDSNACTVGDACGGSQCKPGASLGCDDGNPCTSDSCDPQAGCVNAANSLPCSDGDPCTDGDVCAAKVCSPGAAKACGDGNLCTDDSCDKLKGCVQLPNGATCDDNNVCTQADVCKGGNCVPGVPSACDDGNPCTSETCDPGQGCKNVANTLSCDDKDACTTGDTCKDGQCGAGKAVNCSDGNACSDDSCDKAGGCKNAANTGECSDGNACTSTDTCKDSTCVGGVPAKCDDGNPCTVDVCNPVSGCVALPFALPCSDDNPCTLNDTCSGGACQPGKPQVCDDGNVCTQDVCFSANGCVSMPNQDTCTDGNTCTNQDACDGGKCAGKAVVCNDGNFCTTDYCSADAGCQAIFNTLPCDDGSACTSSDVCGQAICKGTTIACDDGNPCTMDTCDKGKGCAYPAVGDNTPCGLAGICVSGQCSVGSSLNPAPSCLAILQTLGKAAKDGVYFLDPDGAKGSEPPFQAACDMVSDGGGWTLVLKADGNTANFVYDSALWTNKLAFNPDKPGMDASEAKLGSFWTLPFTQLRVGIKTGDVVNGQTIDYKASSLYAVLVDGLYKSWTPALGRSTWKALVPKSTLQANCNREGFNNFVQAPWASVRIGIIANEQNDCGTPDSRLGIGMGGSVCGLDPTSSVGNGAGCGGDLGDYGIKGFGWVWVR